MFIKDINLIFIKDVNTELIFFCSKFNKILNKSDEHHIINMCKIIEYIHNLYYCHT